MVNPIKLLFATDFSPESRKAAALIKTLQEKVTCEIIFLHVIVSKWKEWLSSGISKKSAFQRLQTWQKEICKKIKLDQLYIQDGNAAENIVQLAERVNAEIIFIGGKNLDKKSRYKPNKTVEAVVRQAKQSVWICQTASVSSILCGIDASSHSIKALNEAIKLCRLFSVPLKLVSVLSSVDFSPLGMEEKEAEKQAEHYRKQKIVEMKQFLTQFDFLGLQVEQHFLWGDPAEVILDMAEDFNQELIVVGARGHNLLHHLLLGSTTEKILRYAPCSLLVVR